MQPRLDLLLGRDFYVGGGGRQEVSLTIAMSGFQGVIHCLHTILILSAFEYANCPKELLTGGIALWNRDEA